MKIEARALEQNPEEAKRAAVASAMACLVFGLLLESMATGVALGLLAWLPIFLLQLHLRKARGKKHAALAEAAMPFHLMNIAIELNLGMQFEKALRHSAMERDAFSKELRKAVLEIERQGASVQQALRHLGERVESQMVKRAMVQLSAAFEQEGGKKGEPVKRIAGEMLTRQRVEAKLFSGKMVVSSLLFIGASAIVPALFQSFSIVGAAVLNIGFTPLQILLIITVVFPALDTVVLLYIRSRTPAFLREQ